MSTTAWGSGLSADEVLAFSGHSELAATRLDGAAVKLDWVRFGGIPVHYWKFDEGTGTTAADSGSQNKSFTLSADNWNTATPWLGQASWLPTMSDDGNCVIGSTLTFPAAGATIECWVNAIMDSTQRTLLCAGASPYTPWIATNYAGYPGRLWFKSGGQELRTESNIATDGWHHWAFVVNSDTLRIYIDGSLAVSKATAHTDDAVSRWVLARNPSSTSHWGSDIDDLAVYFTEKYTANFSPHRYEQGYVVLTKPSESAVRRVTGIDWTGTFGTSYGSLYRVQVNIGTDVAPDWVTVGGDNPTSPITGLDVTVQAGVTRWVRAYLNPKADALQSETPILTALRVTHASTGGAPRLYGPQRLGPSLIPLGGLL